MGLYLIDAYLSERISAQTLRGMTLDLTVAHSETFSPLANSHSQLDKVPRRPRLVSTTPNQNE